MTYIAYYLFTGIEIIVFLLPAFPRHLSIRLFILFFYLIAHYYKIPHLYSQIKYKYTQNDRYFLR